MNESVKAGINSDNKTVAIFEKGISQIQYLAESLTDKVNYSLSNHVNTIGNDNG